MNATRVSAPAKGITGTTGIIPLIGHPVAQVKSPPVSQRLVRGAGNRRGRRAGG